MESGSFLCMQLLWDFLHPTSLISQSLPKTLVIHARRSVAFLGESLLENLKDSNTHTFYKTHQPQNHRKEERRDPLKGSSDCIPVPAEKQPIVTVTNFYCIVMFCRDICKL